MKTLHALVSGQVQGVGYRYFVQGRAVALGLSGWVRNLRTGQVEVLVTGEEANLLTLLRDLREGPLFSQVSGVETDWDSPPCTEAFHIRPTG